MSQVRLEGKGAPVRGTKWNQMNIRQKGHKKANNRIILDRHNSLPNNSSKSKYIFIRLIWIGANHSMKYRLHPMMSPMIAMRLPVAISIHWSAIVMCQRILADMRMKWISLIPILSIPPFYVRFTMHSNLEAAEIYIPSRAVVLALMRVGKGKENDLRYTKRWRKGHQNLDEMSERKLSKGHIPFI
jgi:hypothetical protein